MELKTLNNLKDEIAYLEEAEEWVKENMDCCRTDNSVNQSIAYFSEEERCVAKSAFLAGLKAGRPQWHDLRKAPKDLPEKYTISYPLSRTVVNQIGTPCHYNYELQCWQNWSYIEIETPIAWCEIPTFDKE